MILQDRVSSQDSFRNISFLLYIIQTYRVKHDSKNENTIIQAELNTLIDEILKQLNLYDEECASRNATITALTSTLARILGTFWNPVRSCSDLQPGIPSGDY